MAESQLHAMMVVKLKEIVIDEFGEGAFIVFSDDGARTESPPNINGTTPDLYASDPIEDVHIIGEAKTAQDLVTDRSKKQIFDQMQFLADKARGHYLLIVPYGSYSTARSMTKQFSRQLGNPSFDIRVFEYRGR